MYEVIDPEKLARDAGFEAMLASYAKGRRLYEAGDFNAAADAFAQALDQFGADRPSQIMLERARTLASTPPEGNWNGIWSAPDDG